MNKKRKSQNIIPSLLSPNLVKSGKKLLEGIKAIGARFVRGKDSNDSLSIDE